MGGDPDPDDLIVFEVDPHHHADVAAIPFAGAFKGHRIRLAVEYPHEKASFRIAILEFEAVRDRIVGGAFQDILDGGAFDEGELLVFDPVFGAVFDEASRPPETELKTVRTTTILIISRILDHLSKRFGPDFVQKRVDQIDDQNGIEHPVGIDADVADQHGHDAPAGPVNQHGNEVDR